MCWCKSLILLNLRGGFDRCFACFDALLFLGLLSDRGEFGFRCALFVAVLGLVEQWNLFPVVVVAVGVDEVFRS